MEIRQLFIFHYHLKAGGICDVIRHGLTILQKYQSIPVTVVSGTPVDETPFTPEQRVKVVHEPLLAYQQEMGDSEDLAEQLLRCYHQPAGLWWVHNYHLGKNLTFTAALLRIARTGKQPMILQIHDFPECGRPENLKSLSERIGRKRLYPISPHIHYAVINHRDCRYLSKAGVPPSHISVLANPLDFGTLPEVDPKQVRRQLADSFGDEFPGFDPERPLALYPVRSIRRKNVLEAVAINLTLEQPWNVVVTLPGTSQRERDYSARVEQVFRQNGVAGLFGIGQRLPSLLSFPQLCSAADLVVSSAVSEGFGYVFFNALLWKKPLIARYLTVLDGFKTLFQRHPTLFYSSFTVAVDPSMRGQLRRDGSIGEGLSRTRGKSSSVDFALLSFEEQLALVARLVVDTSYRKSVRQLNTWLMTSLPSPAKEPVNLEQCLGPKRFFAAYQQMVRQLGPAQKIEDNAVSDSLVQSFEDSIFLTPLLSDRLPRDPL